MKHFLAVTFTLTCIFGKIVAQQNWAAIPCSQMKNIVNVDKLLVDSLHNEIILYSVNGNTICNTTYKGLFAYNSNGFHDFDKGINTHEGGPGSSALYIWDCITYGNKTLFGGQFNSVGSSPLYAKSLALWNGAVWDTFPTHMFRNVPADSPDGGFYGFLKWNGKLWMYGGFEKIGNTVTKNLVAFDGYTFTPAPTIPVSNNAPITKMIVYKNKLIATGIFYDLQNQNWFRLAQFDGTSWSPVGSGVQGGIAGVWDMQIYKDTLYIAGNWNSMTPGNVGSNMMKWDGNQLYDAGFGPYCGYGLVNTLIPFKNRLYAFGNFPCAANQKAFGVAYYENGAWTVPKDSIQNSAIFGAVLYDNTIYIGGAFKSINGDTTIQKFAKLMCPDFDAKIGCVSSVPKNELNSFDMNVYPNPADNNIFVEINEPVKNDLELNIFNTLGQLIFATTMREQKKELNLSALSPGIYYLKAKGNNAQGVFKIVKE